jgi:phage gpG-like protein
VALTGPAAAYGAVHQLGNAKNKLPNRTGGASAPIPARPFLPLRNGAVALPDHVREEIVEIMRRALTGKSR